VIELIGQMTKPKVPFSPEDAEYRIKPQFLIGVQRFVDLCETRHGAIRCGQGACKVQCGVSVEYNIIIGLLFGMANIQLMVQAVQDPPMLVQYLFVSCSTTDLQRTP
jgi:hypothetical protein